MYRSQRNQFIIYRKSVTIIATVFIFHLIINKTDAHMVTEMTAVEPEMRYDPSGASIKLKCSLRPCQNKSISIKWNFMACGPDLPNKPNCNNSGMNEWVEVPENNKHEQCNSTLHIKKANSNHSGLYRCYTVHSEKITIIKTYQLHVIERFNVQTGEKPRLLDIQPVNVTAIENNKIVIQCKVYSNYAYSPKIWWLKEIDVSDDTNIPIPYNNKTYFNLKASQKEFGNHTFISKLIIENSSENDSGVYMCLAVNVFGSQSKDVYVDVVARNKEWQSFTPFFLLFLIPIGFGLFPISVWLCIHFCRKKKLQKLSKGNAIHTYKYEPVFHRSVRIPNIV